MNKPSIHDFIMSRSKDSTPCEDLEYIGFDGQGMYAEVLGNSLLTTVMLGQMIAEAKGVAEIAISNYAMTWLTIGVCLTEEKHAKAAADNFPPLPDEPT